MDKDKKKELQDKRTIQEFLEKYGITNQEEIQKFTKYFFEKLAEKTKEKK